MNAAQTIGRSDADEVLGFWFGGAEADVDLPRRAWFDKNANFDAQILKRFGPLIERGLRGELASWGADPQTALAEVIVLDQFTRNAFRDTPRAFAGDARALAAASAIVGARHDERLSAQRRAFVYLPFEHAESLLMQDEAVRLFTRLVAMAPQMQSGLDHALRHREVIARFGRFPHRNAALGRQSTAAERQFLTQPGSRF